MTVTPLLQVDNLAIAYKTGDREQRVVHGVSFSVAPGEVVALVGEEELSPDNRVIYKRSKLLKNYMTQAMFAEKER